MIPEFVFEYEKVKRFMALSTFIYNYEGKHFEPISDSYNIMETYEYIINKYEITLFVDIEKTSFQGFVCLNKEDKEICVIMRGTEDFKDFVHDALFFQVQFGDEKGVKVHAGFKRQLESRNANDKIIFEIRRLLLENPDFSINVSGHSLAGALSVLLSYQLSSEFKEKDINVLSIATPRVGNYAFKQSYHSKTNIKHIRLANDRDIITAFPSLFYYHVGDVIKISSDKVEFFERDEFGFCEFSYWKNTSINSHFIKSYWTNLKINRWDEKS